MANSWKRTAIPLECACAVCGSHDSLQWHSALGLRASGPQLGSAHKSAAAEELAHAGAGVARQVDLGMPGSVVLVGFCSMRPRALLVRPHNLHDALGVHRHHSAVAHLARELHDDAGGRRLDARAGRNERRLHHVLCAGPRQLVVLRVVLSGLLHDERVADHLAAGLEPDGPPATRRLGKSARLEEEVDGGVVDHLPVHDETAREHHGRCVALQPRHRAPRANAARARRRGVTGPRDERLSGEQHDDRQTDGAGRLAMDARGHSRGDGGSE
eukprot:TRINITY_DN148_c1_g1_i1.p1 TRINITY_DN148_c1_g1~~TRINITY_DN148_c1_g1_i1.p1  ORF type:complete len:271 (-),score=-38.68 TRINITY_DN148_c1_g1_i1:31-843(-)